MNIAETSVPNATLFHLSAQTGWRGGENQFELIYRGLQGQFQSRAIVRRASELAKRLRDLDPVEVSAMGFLAPTSALALRGLQKTMSRPHLFHAHCSKSAETALLARLGRKVPVIISRRNAFPIHSGWKYRNADAVIAISQATRDMLIKAGVKPSRVHVIPDAVDPARFLAAPSNEGADAGDVTVLCAAAIEAEKDFATLLKAWAQVEGAHPHARLLIAGTGSMESAMRKRASSLGLTRVRFLGWRDDLPALVAASDIAVLSSRMEGLASFLCEAQFCGKPVVATDAGGIVDAVEDGSTGFLSAVGEPELLAQSLKRLIDDENLRLEMGHKAALRAKNLFALEAVLAAHRSLYSKLLSI